MDNLRGSNSKYTFFVVVVILEGEGGTQIP